MSTPSREPTVSHSLSMRQRPVVYNTPSRNVVHYLDLGRRARQEARIAELLGPAGLVFLRDLLAATP